MTSPRPEIGTGTLLRIKEGFNPNSSSVGSQIPLFFFFALGSGTLTLTVMNLLNAYDRKIRGRRGNDENEPAKNE